MNEFGSLETTNQATGNSNQTTSSSDSLIQKINAWRDRHVFLSIILEVIVLLIFIVLPFRYFVAQPFMVSGESMVPTFHNQDYLIVNQLSHTFGKEFNRYDVIVFKYPGDESKYFIKRVIGLPGERVVVSDGETTVYSNNNPEGLLINSDYANGTTIGSADVELGSDEYFVLGDNRENSSDSRFWGPLPLKNIVGTPFVRVYPFSDAGLHPGEVAP